LAFFAPDRGHSAFDVTRTQGLDAELAVRLGFSPAYFLSAIGWKRPPGVAFRAMARIRPDGLFTTDRRVIYHAHY
jgi:hypothetical protein